MNLYAHFPFCRRKCAYCALYSRTGVSQEDRDAYARRLAAEIASGGAGITPGGITPGGAGESGQRGRPLPTANCQLPTTNCLATVYFGGGSPALCDLRPLFAALAPHLPSVYEFTVELHPLDVSEPLLATLKAGGVNRISMGVQAFDDATLTAMERGYTVAEALRAFELIKRHFDNAGLDLIVGFPGDPGPWKENARRYAENLRRFAELGLRHCSVYSLQNERNLRDVPDDDIVLDGIREVSARLKSLGLERYEISNYATPGRECRHNLAVWRGEDYVGLGEGACGRIGLRRTRGVRSGYETETLSPEEDLKERTIFRLRTREGLDASRFPAWRPILDRFVAEGLLTTNDRIPTANDQLPSASYRLTPRGTEVCDSILAEIV